MRHPLLGPLEGLDRELAIGIGLLDLRLQLRVIDLEERRPGGHLLPFPHEDIGDLPLNLRMHLDGLYGLDLSCRGDRFHHGVADRDGDFDGMRESSAPLHRVTACLVARGYGRGVTVQAVCGTTSRVSLIGESTAQNAFESAARESPGVVGLHAGGIGLEARPAT